MNARLIATLFAISIAATACGGGGSGSGGTSPLPPGNMGGGSTPTPSPSINPTGSPLPTAPPQYASLYSAVSSKVAQFASSVSAQCPNPSTATKIYEEFAPANANAIYPELAGASAGTVNQYVANALNYAAAYKRNLGVTGFRISISYPTLTQNPANLPNSSFTTANYSIYLSYYQQLIAGMRSMGLGVDVETNILMPEYAGSNYNYNGLTLATLEAGVAETAQNVIDNLKPDHVNLASEPATIFTTTGLPSTDFDQNGYPAYVAAVRSQFTNSNPGATLVGAGVDDWQPVTLAGNDPFITNLLAQTNLDYYDMHLYPPDQMQAGIADMNQLRASTNKPLVITESWDDKEDVGTDGTTEPIDPQVVTVRDAYSFWENGDAQYVTSLIAFARCTNVTNLDLSYPLQAFVYIDYNTATANYSYAQMSSALNMALGAAESSGTISPAGLVVARYTGAR